MLTFWFQLVKFHYICFQLANADSTSFSQALSHVSHYLEQCGYSRRQVLENKMTWWMNYVTSLLSILSVALLTRTLSILALMKKNPQLMQQAFCAKEEPLAACDVNALFTPNMDDIGSNMYPRQELSLMHWRDYLQDCEGTVCAQKCSVALIIAYVNFTQALVHHNLLKHLYIIIFLKLICNWGIKINMKPAHAFTPAGVDVHNPNFTQCNLCMFIRWLIKCGIKSRVTHTVKSIENQYNHEYSTRLCEIRSLNSVKDRLWKFGTMRMRTANKLKPSHNYGIDVTTVNIWCHKLWVSGIFVQLLHPVPAVFVTPPKTMKNSETSTSLIPL